MNDPSLDTWTIVFLIAALQGLFLSLVIFSHKSGSSSTNHYLAIFVLLFSLTLIDYFSYWSNYRFILPHTFGFSFGFPFFYGPVLFFYILKLNNHPLPALKYRWLQFIPGIVYYISGIKYFRLPAQEKIDLFLGADHQSLFDFLFYPTLQVVHLSIYAALIFLYIMKQDHPFASSKFYNWQGIIAALFLVFILAKASYYILVASINFEIEYDYMISMTMALSIYAIGYLGYKHPEILHGFENVRTKYERSSLNPEEADNLLAGLNELLRHDEIFRDSDLKLPDVAEKLNTSPHHLSQLVNEKLGKSFPDLINSYRIAAAKQMLIDPNHGRLKILSIAFETGFNNKANFNNTFKKFTGMAPSDYRKLHQVEFVN